MNFLAILPLPRPLPSAINLYEITCAVLKQTSKLPELPSRLEKEQLIKVAHLEKRFEVAKLTNAISVLTDGVLSMKTTLVGIIQVSLALNHHFIYYIYFFSRAYS